MSAGITEVSVEEYERLVVSLQNKPQSPPTESDEEYARLHKASLIAFMMGYNEAACFVPIAQRNRFVSNDPNVLKAANGKWFTDEETLGLTYKKTGWYPTYGTCDWCDRAGLVGDVCGNDRHKETRFSLVEYMLDGKYRLLDSENIAWAMMAGLQTEDHYRSKDPKMYRLPRKKWTAPLLALQVIRLFDRMYPDRMHLDRSQDDQKKMRTHVRMILCTKLFGVDFMQG
jgi:hypothetical protein